MIRGVDLKRDLSNSDLDITIDEFEISKDLTDDYVLRSDNNDFDVCVKKMHGSDVYTKIDIRVDPESIFDVINFGGVNYNVSKLEEILFWKSTYAKKGIKKHEDDLITIQTGIRPPEPVQNDFDDDLPF